MDVITVINCPDRACVEEKIAAAKKFMRTDDWIHIDVTDGIFSAHATWHDPAAFAAMGIPFNKEVHLMVARPEDYIAAWRAAGAQRIIVHVETITVASARNILAAAGGEKGTGATVMLASNPDTPIEALNPYLGLFSEFLVLAVRPGPAGQSFDPSALEKIKFLKREGAIMIEVDGGMNPETAALVKDAGADTIASGAYIFGSADPAKAYEALRVLEF